MNLNHANYTSVLPKTDFRENQYRPAYHAAGPAAAIYLGNQQNGLPPVYFQIRIISPLHAIHQSGKFARNYHNEGFAQVEGGLLITHIPDSIDDATKAMNTTGKFAYEQAFEADIIDLLVGPIAEAHYVASRDGEVITPRLVNLTALHNYCPKPEMAILQRRISCMNAIDKDRKLFGLYLQAFDFVTGHSNWQAIKTIASFLLTTEKPVIGVDEIVDIVDMARTKKINRFHNLAGHM